MASDTTLLAHKFPRSPTVAWEIRRALDSLWLDVPPTALPTARLLSSELASNAVRHGQGEHLDVVVRTRGEQLRVEVTDDGDGFTPPTRGASPAGGWGLALVETLSSRWGIEDGSTRVWFELPLDPTPSNA